jgi:HK97 family phage portal protein
MGLFDFMKKRDSETTTTTPVTTPEINDVLLQALLNGEAITREKAMTLPAVAGAVDFISNMIASMPVKLYKYKQGKVEEVEGDTRVALLNGDTGDTLDAFQLKKAMVEDYLLDKGGYAYIRRNRNEVTGLFYVEPIRVSLINNYQPIYKNYRIIVEGDIYYPHDFLKLLRKTTNGSEGVGVVDQLSKALETAYNTLLYQLGLVQAGGSKKGFLKSQRKLGQDEINTLKQAWRNLYANNTENVVVLNNGLEFQEAANTSVEMQLNESKKTLEAEINNIFHISDDFYETFKQAIYPIVKAFTTAMNTTLLLEKEKGKYYFDLDVKEIIKANVQERYEAYKVAKETGWLSFNEIRKMENMNYIEGLDVVNVGLGAVLYDFNTHQYYTPNTDTTTDPTTDGTNPDTTDENIEKVLTDKVIDTEFEEDGNSSAREERFNPNHDGKTGKFTTGGGSGGAGGSTEGSGGSSGSDSEGGSSSGGSSSNSSGGKEEKLKELEGKLDDGLDKLDFDQTLELYNKTKDPDMRDKLMTKMQEKDPFRYGKEVYGIDMKPVEYKGTFEDAVKKVNEKNKDKPFIEETVYHGTNATFDKFDYDHFGVHDKGDFGQGIYTTKDKNTAAKYGKDIKEVEIKYKNPLVLNTDSDLDNFNLKYGDEWGEAKQIYNSKQLAISIMGMGYDAVIDNVYGQTIVFDLDNTNIKK